MAFWERVIGFPLLLLALGGFFALLYHNPARYAFKKADIKVIAPDYGIASVPIVESLQLKTEVEAYIAAERRAGRLGRAAVQFHSFRDGSMFVIGPTEIFHAGHLMELPVTVATLRKLESEPLYWNPHLKAASRSSAAMGEFDDLFNRMTVHSEAASLATLSEFAGDRMDKLYHHLGYARPDPKNPTAVVVQHSALVTSLFESNYLRPEHSRKAIYLGAQSDFHDGLELGLPPKVPVAHWHGSYQSGTGNFELHDCGIIYLGDAPYSLCVLTEGPDAAALNSVVAGISRICFDWMK